MASVIIILVKVNLIAVFSLYFSWKVRLFSELLLHHILWSFVISMCLEVGVDEHGTYTRLWWDREDVFSGNQMSWTLTFITGAIKCKWLASFGCQVLAFWRDSVLERCNNWVACLSLVYVVDLEASYLSLHRLVSVTPASNLLTYITYSGFHSAANMKKKWQFSKSAAFHRLLVHIS
mgnify:CR=1 FL=1